MSPSAEDLIALVRESLSTGGRCYFHCGQETRFMDLVAERGGVGLHHCSRGYVARVVYFDMDPDLRWFSQWLRSRAEPLEVSEMDVRVATRHPWEFGLEADVRGGLEPYLVRQVYWTQSRAPEGAPALHVCVGTSHRRGCSSFFVQPNTATVPLCPKCVSDRPSQ